MTLALGRKAEAAGYRLVAYETIESTNQEALRRAVAGDPGRLWVASTHQTAGRGRRGRHWETPPGNLAASLLLIVKEGPTVAATLGFVAGLALDEALRHVAPSLDVVTALDAVEDGGEGGHDRLRLKWPNDVLLDGAKLAGILLEAHATAGDRLAVVVGIGVNVVSSPRQLPYPAVSLAELDVAVDAPGLFETLSDAWVGLEHIWNGGRGFAKIRELWLDRATGLGQPAAVRVGDEVFSGVFETIDEEGRLIVRMADGDRRAITAGEVHFASAATVRA